MRYLFAVVAILAIFNTGIVSAQDAAKAAAPQSAEKPIVVDSNDEDTGDKEYVASEGEKAASEQVYDENTGLPNVVGSDENGEMR